MTNDPEDRHVLAATVRSKAELIVTFNLRHFPVAALESWGVVAQHPADFLINLYSMDPPNVVSKIDAIARDRNWTSQEYLQRLGKVVPTFSQFVADELGWDLT